MKLIKIPHTYVIIFSVIILAAAATWFIPAGKFDRVQTETKSGKREIIIPHSYKPTEQSPQTWQVFSAFYKGFIRSPKIIVFILILGGAFWIINESKAIDAGIHAFLKRSKIIEKNALMKRLGVHNLIIASIMLIFSFFGAVFGMSEETIAFVIIFVPLSISMGFDSIVGVCMCFIAAGLGFAGCMMNPFTLGIAQEISGVPMFSGIGYRFIIWLVVTFVGIAYVLIYANKIRRNPKKSIMYETDSHWRKSLADNTTLDLSNAGIRAWIVFGAISLVLLFWSIKFPMNDFKFGQDVVRIPFLPISTVLFVLMSFITIRRSMQYFVLNILFFTIIYLVAGVIGWDWSLLEIASLFFVMGVASGVAMGKSADDIVKLFVAGGRDILSAALVVGLAGGIIVILEDGCVIDTILYKISFAISGFGNIATLSLMYVFQSFLNMIITSGTAKAALIMPILSDISEMVNLSKQATVTAFHIGDGFTNLITPTSGVLIGVLEVARIPYGKWFKWALPFIILLVILGWLLLIPTVTIPLTGF